MKYIISYFILAINLIAADYKYNLSVCSIFKNEAPYFREWIEYHKLVGVEHFYLYNNGSDDDFEKVLEPYIKNGDVTLVDWPNQLVELWNNHIWAWVYTTQVSAYEDAIKRAYLDSKWIAPIDIDEFIVPVAADSIVEILDRYEFLFPGVEVKWRVYGTSFLNLLPENKLLIESLNRYSHPNHPLNQSFKSIFKTSEYQKFTWPPHKCAYVSGYESLQIDPNELVINHYTNRTIRYFLDHKIKNKQNMDNVKLSLDEIRAMLSVGNDLEDKEKTIHKFVPQLRKKLGFD